MINGNYIGNMLVRIFSRTSFDFFILNVRYIIIHCTKIIVPKIAFGNSLTNGQRPEIL